VTVPAFLAELRRKDIQVWADGDRLRCNAPAGVLTPELRDLLQHRKQDILEFLRSAATLAEQQRAVVPLQPRGGRTPVFGVPGHNGDVFCYSDLVRHLGNDQPFYGLQPPGLDGVSEPLTRIEDLAAYLAAQIRAFHPGGRCVIAGFCAGGMIAFELGRQLCQAGVAVDLVALFGAPYPSAYRFLPRVLQSMGAGVERVVKHTRGLASLPLGQWQWYIAERLRGRRERSAAESPSAPDAVLVLRAKVERATIAAASRYTPGYFPGRVNLFLPGGEWLRAGKDPLLWRTVAQDTEVYFGPEASDGHNMLREPHAGAFAELFGAALSEGMVGLA
jgi:thioesterase domain-containing protein